MPTYLVGSLTGEVGEVEDVDGALIAPTKSRVPGLPCHSSVAGDGDGVTEAVILHHVRGGELGLLAPGDPVTGKDVGRAGVLAPIVNTRRSHYNDVSGDGDRGTELVIAFCV